MAFEKIQTVHGHQKQKTGGMKIPNDEETLIGCILFEPSYCIEIMNHLKSEAFQNQIWKKIYEATLELKERETEINLLTVDSHLQAQGINYSNELMRASTNTYTATFALEAARRILRKHESIRIRKILTDSLHLLNNGKIKECKETLRELRI